MDVSIEANPYIDSSVGALVWVRRRNGSWWPGRILGPEELPGSHLLSPRTGTPVKLLGREDGSVDWYNIEKSRRVKAFRCGDFDECIERAKSLASVLTKKREKYARREDAILHALELEKKHIEQNYLFKRSFIIDHTYKHMRSFADDDMILDDDMDGMANHSGFQSDFMDPESSADATQASLDSLFSLQGDKKFLDGDWEDDITDALPRMRGLQDIDLKAASAKERKADWSASYEHNPHLSFAEDEQKMSSCITRNTVPCPAPISSKTSCTLENISKRKRPSQAGCIEDETSLKKRDRRRQMNSVLESSLKLADGTIVLGSKASVPYFISSMESNGRTTLQPKQEGNVVMLGNSFHGSSEMKPLTSVCGPDFWPATPTIEAPTRHDMIDPSPVMDKACSSFSNHVNANCCEGRQYLFVDSQMEPASLTGPAFSDPFGQGVPGSSCSMFPRPMYPGTFAGISDNSFQKAGFLAMPESLCCQLPVFPPWPYCGVGPREILYEKYGHEIGLRGQVASCRAAGFPEYSFEGTIPNVAPPLYSVYNNPLEDHSTLAKNSAVDRDSSLPLAQGIIKGDILKGSRKSPKQCLSAVADGEGETDEDEADSFQPPPDSTIGSPKAVGSRDAHSSVKHKHALDGSCDTSGCHKLKGTAARNGFINVEGRWNESLDDGCAIHGYSNRSKAHSDCNGSVAVPMITKWQAKGRRGVRASSRNSWVSPAVGVALRGIVPAVTSSDAFDKIHEELDIIPSGFKSKKRASRGIRSSSAVDFSSEEEPVKEKSRSWSRQQPAYEGHVQRANRLYLGSNQSLATLDVPNFSWFEVPVGEDHARSGSCHEQVPQVSIISMLKGKPIVGYAVRVEVVDRRYEAGQEGASMPHPTGNPVRKPHPVWRTGRRTAMQRIPRSCGTVASKSTEPDRGQLQVKHCNFQIKGMRKGMCLTCSSSEKRKPSKKQGLAPKKTRMLSSIASEAGTEHDATRNVAPPLETCIPVNVIFSRIREVLYRGLNNGASDSDNVS